MYIIGIAIGLIAIVLVFYFRKDQQMTNNLSDCDIRALENGYKALMEEFTNYQVDNERKLLKLEKLLEIKERRDK
tara:strand:+ start:918 stop:1142 length:225 start_codon:yes stop_codon:yes gene_type:complete